MNEDGLNQIKRHEGLRLKPYKCTADKLTIGYGRNLEDRGITEEEAEYLLKNDVQDFIDKVDERWPWVQGLDLPRRWVVYNMAFNMGIEGLAKFVNTLEAMSLGEYERAANGMEQSKWYSQVGNRSKELVYQMRTGEWQQT